MKSKNIIVISGMRFVAVLSILSMTVFSSSVNVAYANSGSNESSYSESSHENDESSHDNEDKDYRNNDSHEDGEESLWSHKDKDDDHDSDESDNQHGDYSNDDSGKDKNRKKHDKITICHATHSDSNPYVEITISVSGKDAHKHHQDKEDIIPAPKDGCPKGHGNSGGHHEGKNTAPVIKLVGSSTVYLYQGQTYSDQGATANDREDGDITSKVVSISNVNTSVVGTYTVTYDVEDSKGLCAETVTRTVIVKPTLQNNTAPVITLIGLNPITLYQGDIYLDPGATANDLEDGNITSSIVKEGVVDRNTIGTYTVTYNVKDSKGLSAETVTRTVNVIEKVVIPNKGKITFCLVLANDQNSIATSSYGLPQGVFKISLASTSPDNASTTIKTKNWDIGTFEPNKKVILNQNDSDCVTYENLGYGIYQYSSLDVNGASWNLAKYNDQDTQPVNNVFDFFQYGNTNTNSDGYIVLDENRYERTLYIYNTYKPASACSLPEINSLLTASTNVNQSFTYVLNASSTSSIEWSVATTSLPAGLAFSTTTQEISGTPTVSGVFNVALKAINTCGYDEETLVINILGGNGGGSTPSANLSVLKTANKTSAKVGDEIVYTISLTNNGPENAKGVKVTDVLSNAVDFISASTTVGSYSTTTSEWVIGDFANGSTTALEITVKVKSGTEGQTINNKAEAVSNLSDSDTSNNTSSVSTLVIVPTVSGGGGGGGNGGGGTPIANGPIAGSLVSTGGGIVASVATSTPVVQGCNYLLDYLRKDFNNNPIEVLKLQAFLKTFEGFTDLQLTGVYDQATIDAVNVFQMRYKDDVLTPWGHTAPTSYVYILTKKKVNEIYCKFAFPVTVAQQDEIDNYRNSNKGVYTNTSTDSGEINTAEVGYGSGTTSSNPGIAASATTTKVTTGSSSVKTATSGITNVANVGLTTLAGLSSSTKNIAADFVANIVSSGKKAGNLLGALFSIPGKIFSEETDNICKDNSSLLKGLNIILLLVIIALSYMWYRSNRNNKKIEEINKEIDLQ